MTRRIWTMGVIAAGLVGLASLAGLAAANSDRPDCPGKIVCPLTGKLVCKDRCPARDTSRPDCPGQIVCPLTGKLVCKDRCPLNGNGANDSDSAPEPSCSCCRKGQSDPKIIEKG
jgi:hypothetical protein